ncbi:thiamine pyrophosphate-binding protein [Chloroflexota bacterium]
MKMDGGDLLLEALISYGIEYIFCSPGLEWVPVWESLARRSGKGENTLKYINCRHESLAVSMALGYSKATGRLPAVLLHASVGPLHSAMAIRAAYQAKAPMLICTGDTSNYTEDEAGRGPGWHWLSLLSDIGGPDALVRLYVKWCNAVTSTETLLDAVGRGCDIARKLPEGPVFLAVPWQLLLKPLPEVRILHPSPATLAPESHSYNLEEVAKQLLESKQPIIITEHVGENSEAVSKLIELAELMSIPVYECVNPRFANFPKNHPLHMGYDASEALREADTVFVVGATTPWYPPSAFPQNDAKVIFLDEDPLKEQLPYWGYRIDLSVTGDMEQCLAALVSTIRTHIHRSDYSGPHYRERRKRWRTKHEQLVEQWKTEALAGKRIKPISPKWFLYMVNQLLPSNSVIVYEAVTNTSLIHRYFTEPTCLLGTSGGGLGLGLGVATGTKLAYQDRPVILLVGDGSFNYNPVLAGLGLCQEYHLPILTVILNNGSYAAMIKGYQKYYPQGWAATHNKYFGVDIAPEPDYTKVAEAFDVYSERLEEPDNIESAINRALQQIERGRAALLDVILAPRI